MVSQVKKKEIHFNNSDFVAIFYSVETCVKNLSQKIKFKCVFWDYKKSEWSTKGCIYFFSKENLHACQCNHLTNFAILMSLDTETISCKLCNTILKYLTYVGNFMSMLGLLCTIAVYLSDKIKRLKHQRFNSNENRFKLMFDYYIEILICLSISLFLLNLFYVIFSFLKWDENSNSCMTIGVLLHYFLLGSFSWMLSLSILQYFTFNRIFVTIQNYFIKALIFSLGAPVIPIGIILSINWELYKHPNLKCWLSGKTAVLGVIAPLATIVLINLIIFGLITKNHCKFKKISESKMESKKKTVIVSTCFLNMGLTWTLGFFIFLVYIILSKSRRKMLLKKFGNLKLCKIVLELDEFDKNSKKTEVTRQTTFLALCYIILTLTEKI
ncbi:G-coupled receptor -like protein [Brachionus plicatilis]|uniref:G-coupled receptor-like protein n=1 Tax=Brachionus plicatilis TaxID=10195 RepID=A0A3M7SL72_BRAPC|nr:G-coupled receptor -like protein [Brachionus plicatilis]